MGSFQGKRVSADWEVVLEAAWEDGVRFQLNSGRRTMSEQQLLFDQNMYGPGRPKPGRAFTAVPDPSAPHIRAGRNAHALDVDSRAYDDGENRLQRWLVKHGARPTNPVRGESWHLEVSESELERLASKFRRKWRGYTGFERRWIEEYDRLLRSGQDKARREVLRRVMKGQRQEIWKAAKASGWGKSNRLRRYASLRARS